MNRDKTIRDITFAVSFVFSDFFDAEAQRHKGSQRFFKGFFAAVGTSVPRRLCVEGACYE